MRGGDDEIDSAVLLRQGDALLKSSRALLDDLSDVIDLTDVPAEADDAESDRG